MKFNHLLCIPLLLVVGAPPAFAADADKVKVATAAAEKWLALVDEGKAVESWKESAELIRQVLTDEQWAQAMKAIRAPLGKVASRKVKSATYTTKLDGAPDGEYVVIQYETAFENKKEAIETVVPQLEKDGQWRVSGYYIK